MPGRPRCSTCGRPAAPVDHVCDCGGRVTFEYPLAELARWTPSGRGLSRYLPLLPAHDAAVHMGEGGTPLVASRRIGSALGIHLHFKLESLNPTGSYKDRIAAVGVGLARASPHGPDRYFIRQRGRGHRCLRGPGRALRGPGGAGGSAGGEIDADPLVRRRGCGCPERVLGTSGRAASVRSRCTNGRHARLAADDYGLSLRAWAMEGAKTVAHEIVEALRGAPDRVYVPVGGAGLLTAT